MSNVVPISFKERSSSAGSTTSSVTEYVNEVFENSELEFSKVVRIEVSHDLQYIKNPQAGISENDIPKTEKSLQNFNIVSVQNESFKFMPRGFRKMYVAALVVLFFAICMGMTVTYTATATVDMKRSHSSIHPTEDAVTWIGSLIAVGALFGGAVGGFFTNVFGRKGALMFNTAPFVVGWILVAYASSLGMIYIGRLITGFSSGIVSVATPMYLVEISTPEIRGLLGASFQLFVVIGVLIVTVLGSKLTWRYLAISGAAMSLLAAFLMLPMPESPKWLMAKKRRGEAKNAIKFLQGESFDAEGECVILEEEIKSQPKGSVRPSEMKSPTFYKPFVLSILLMYFQQFSGVNAIMFYTVEIFQSASSSSDPVSSAIILALVQVISTLLGSVLMDKAGRKPLLLISGVCMALSLYVFGVFEICKVKNPAITQSFGWLPLVCLIAFISAFSIGFGPTPWLMVAEMTPTRFRGIVSAVATALNWAFAFCITKSFKTLAKGIHTYGVYWSYGTVCILSLIVVTLFLPETKGKKMSEIEDSFTHKCIQVNTFKSKRFRKKCG